MLKHEKLENYIESAYLCAVKTKILYSNEKILSDFKRSLSFQSNYC